MQNTAYELRISDWSSDVCSSDLISQEKLTKPFLFRGTFANFRPSTSNRRIETWAIRKTWRRLADSFATRTVAGTRSVPRMSPACAPRTSSGRSEEHTSELQSLMRISYAVFCLKKKKKR